MENVDAVSGKFDATQFKRYLVRAKCFDIDAGKFIVVLNETEAKENSISMGERVLLTVGDRQKIVIVDLGEDLVRRGEIGIFADTGRELGIKDGEIIDIKPSGTPASIELIKSKMDGAALTAQEIDTIVSEMMQNRLSDAEIASWIAAMYMKGMTIEEIVGLCSATVKSGEVLNLNKGPIVDKHCIGGIAGNRTTMVIVPILAAAGLYMPKTSSRSISSASGTADTMEVLAPVEFSIKEMRDIVLKTKGCIVWGGAINLAAADDKLIRIRHSLSLDPRGVLLASILAKKVSVGAEYVVIDLPVGRGTKFESLTEAKSLARDFINVGSRLNIQVECLITEGADPIGERIGPALECYDVLEVLQGRGPSDLKDKSCQLAGAIFEKCGRVAKGKGFDAALELLRNGKAYLKMKEIIEAQGGDPDMKVDSLPIGTHKYSVEASEAGRIEHVDNHDISRIARAAGAPNDKGAGLILHCEHGDKVKKGDVLFEIVAESETKLEFAIKTLSALKPVELQKVVLGKVD